MAPDPSLVGKELDVVLKPTAPARVQPNPEAAT
jgi:hypothetical protein